MRRGAEDDRILAAPAVRVTMPVIFAEEQHAFSTHELDDLRIRFKDTLAREVFDFAREASGVVNGTVNIELVLFADHKIIMPVTGRSMHETRSGFARRRFFACLFNIQFRFSISLAAERHMIAKHYERRTVEPRMTTFKTIKTRAGKTREHSRRDTLAVRVALADVAFAGDCTEQFTGDDVNFITVLKSRVLKFWIDGDAEIRWH